TTCLRKRRRASPNRCERDAFVLYHGSGICGGDHIEARGDGTVGPSLPPAGVVSGQDEEVPGPRFPRTLQAVPEQLSPGFGVPREIGPADRLDEQEIARERAAVVGEQREAAERVTRHVSGAQRRPSEGDRVPVSQRLIGQPARRL